MRSLPCIRLHTYTNIYIRFYTCAPRIPRFPPPPAASSRSSADPGCLRWLLIKHPARSNPRVDLAVDVPILVPPRPGSLRHSPPSCADCPVSASHPRLPGNPSPPPPPPRARRSKQRSPRLINRFREEGEEKKEKERMRRGIDSPPTVDIAHGDARVP